MRSLRLLSRCAVLAVLIAGCSEAVDTDSVTTPPQQPASGVETSSVVTAPPARSAAQGWTYATPREAIFINLVGGAGTTLVGTIQLTSLSDDESTVETVSSNVSGPRVDDSFVVTLDAFALTWNGRLEDDRLVLSIPGADGQIRDITFAAGTAGDYNDAVEVVAETASSNAAAVVEAEEAAAAERLLSSTYADTRKSTTDLDELVDITDLVTEVDSAIADLDTRYDEAATTECVSASFHYGDAGFAYDDLEFRIEDIDTRDQKVGDDIFEVRSNAVLLDQLAGDDATDDVSFAIGDAERAVGDAAQALLDHTALIDDVRTRAVDQLEQIRTQLVARCGEIAPKQTEQ